MEARSGLNNHIIILINVIVVEGHRNALSADGSFVKLSKDYSDCSRKTVEEDLSI